MNFLAHLYLSGNNEELMIGNFIADSVKGSDYKNYSTDIARGILLHRAIDTYTDAHPVFLESVKRLRTEHGKFSGVIADIFYDHFLAVNWIHYSEQSLEEYVEGIHKVTTKHQSIMPEKSRLFLKYTIHYNWLVGYAKLEGIDEVLYGMSRRTKYANTIESAGQSLRRNYLLFENEFKIFFEDMQLFVASWKSSN